MVRKSEHSRFILTTRPHILSSALRLSERLARSALTEHRCVLELDSYTFGNRARILYNHLYFSELPQAYKKAVLDEEFFLEIIKHEHFNPRLIEWLSTDLRRREVPVDRYRPYIRQLLASPHEIWNGAFRNHKSSGLPEEELIPSNADERGLYALRIVVERCLYGVDRNPLAVEMAKLSLWLLTLQRSRPFTFLDHSIRCGDSLLGVDLKQLSTWSLSGEGKQTVLFQDDLSFAASKREGLMKLMYRTSDQKRMLDAALEKTQRLRAAADRLIATAFEANFEAAAAAITFGFEEQETEAQKILAGRRPFHWAVEFPEVFMHNGGFDAILGNPPFIGGQRITGALGTSYRDYLVRFVAGGKRGSADYVAYFFLRAFGLLKDGGTAGLLATNTVAQGDTREVGLDQMVSEGANIFRAIPSRKWPGEASLEVAHIWLRKGNWKGTCFIEDSPVKAITTQLDVPGNVIGKSFRLAANAKKSFQGSIVLGMGYVLTPDHAQQLLERNPRNREVLFPYLKGEDLTERWDQSPSRWVINFRDWPIEKAMEYPDCFEIVERDVMPERTRRRENGDYQLRYPLYERWWQYGEKRPALYSAIEGLGRVLVAVRVSSHHCISLVPSKLVYSDRLAVFAFESSAEFALLTSTLHDGWAHRPGATTHETRNTYFPEQSFETFPFPVSISPLACKSHRAPVEGESLRAKI